MKREIWIGLVELRYARQEAPQERKWAFTNVTTWAGSSQEFLQKAKEMVEHYGWEFLGVEEARPVDQNLVYSAELAHMIERARDNPNVVLYGTFHVHPGHDS